ncbi:hypothetical protein LX36DRAFT_189586 [Colletotrichum falcatum]|nr:hypothetical protein LX36DRAFT_189586 [Colletotrichum falcatum]
MALRCATLYTGQILTFCTAGLIAAAVFGTLEDKHGLADWKQLFIVLAIVGEGLTMIVLFVLLDYLDLNTNSARCSMTGHRHAQRSWGPDLGRPRLYLRGQGCWCMGRTKDHHPSLDGAALHLCSPGVVDSDKPHYRLAFVMMMTMGLFACAFAMGLGFYLYRVNKRLDKGAVRNGTVHNPYVT